ncbi:MAG: zinc ribbon domain-containing protein [Candidatus Omnitrophota bacterium]|nr:zinc ribbon domain-containing protein [Candidatus Omnitrophota bacterium]
MPTYDYECLKCGKISEAFHKINDRPLKECPHCKGKVKKLISSGSGLIFKGSGFYITDYKKKKPSQSQEKKSPKKEGSSK